AGPDPDRLHRDRETHRGVDGRHAIAGVVDRGELPFEILDERPVDRAPDPRSQRLEEQVLLRLPELGPAADRRGPDGRAAVDRELVCGGLRSGHRVTPEIAASSTNSRASGWRRRIEAGQAVSIGP